MADPAEVAEPRELDAAAVARFAGRFSGDVILPRERQNVKP